MASVRRALDGLAPRDRELLLMREEGFSYREIGGAVGVSASSVGTLIARAQKRFTDAWTAEVGSSERPAARGEG